MRGGGGAMDERYDLKAACRRIMGRQSLKALARNGISPSQRMEAVAMLDEGWNVYLVLYGVRVL